MNDIERMMISLPRLKHLELRADCNNDVVDGERWQMQVKSLVIFHFKLHLSDELVSEDLDSFRTSFWVEEKRWFVAYTHRCLFSVPRFCVMETDQNFQPPLYSTVPDNSIFYDCIKRLKLSETTASCNHRFTHVGTLTLYSSCFLSAIDTIVNIDRIYHLILHSSTDNFSMKGLINKMSNLRHISIQCDADKFVEQFHGTTVDQIQMLDIYTGYGNSTDCDIDQFYGVFPMIKHFRVGQICSIIQIFYFLYRFKHLSTASFRYIIWHETDNDARVRRLKIQAALDRAKHAQRLNYTYRFDSAAVHFWM